MTYGALKPQNLPEKLIWYYIICIYPIYYLGGQYLLAPILGYFLVFYLFKRWWGQTPATPPDERITIPLAVWLWIVGVLMIEVALIIGHLDFDLGLAKTISSSINRWFRTWALLPVFMLAGSLKIRPQLIYRAICIVCIQSLFLALVAIILRMPDIIYTSPLKIFGGGAFYEVSIFGTMADDGDELRLVLFTPWAPALGLVANVYFFLARKETNRLLRWLGMMGAIAMIVGSVSRLAMICLPLTLGLTWWLLNIYRPSAQLTTGLVAFFGGLFGTTIINELQLVREQISHARASSSRVRSILGRIAVNRWLDEAFVWGHGSVADKGPKVTGLMPIGTHHTWFSVLYNHGLVGCLSLAIPLTWSAIELVVRAQKSRVAEVGLNIILVLIIFTIGENIDGLSYLYWPGLIVLGVAFQENFSSLPLSTNSINRFSTLN